MTWDEAYKQVDEYSELESDWDGQGAAAVIPLAWTNAKAICQACKALGAREPEFVRLAPDGTICIEFGINMEIEIGNEVEAWTFPVPEWPE